MCVHVFREGGGPGLFHLYSGVLSNVGSCILCHAADLEVCVCVLLGVCVYGHSHIEGSGGGGAELTVRGADR